VKCRGQLCGGDASLNHARSGEVGMQKCDGAAPRHGGLDCRVLGEARTSESHHLVLCGVAVLFWVWPEGPKELGVFGQTAVHITR
jgi:hypothetical protein